MRPRSRSFTWTPSASIFSKSRVNPAAASDAASSRPVSRPGSRLPPLPATTARSCSSSAASDASARRSSTRRSTRGRRTSSSRFASSGVKNRISDIVTSAVTARVVIIACFLVAVAVACGERPEPLGDVSQRYPVTVAGAGERPTVVPALPERIVALDPGSTELLLALGARERLVGVPAGIRRGAGPLTARPGAAEIVSRTMDVQVDEIVKLDPDLIVATPATDLLDVSRAQRETGAAVYLQPNVSIDGVLRAALELGVAVGEPVAGRAIASRIRSQVALVEDRIASEPKVTTFVDRGFFITIPER